jgi:PD-(D/E)XK nuclease superfamily
MAKKFAWSFSALGSYELCAKKHWHVNIAKDVKEPPNDAGEYGQVAHKHFENRMMKSKPLPLDLRHHESPLLKLAAVAGVGYGEQKLALNDKFELTGYFDSDVWVRTIIDWAVVSPDGTKALIVDWKFGKKKDDEDQLELMAAVLFAAMPELENIIAAFYLAKEKEFVRQAYDRHDIPHIWNNFLPRVEALEHAVKNSEFPATPGFLCKSWCWVKSCPHCGNA